MDINEKVGDSNVPSGRSMKASTTS